MRIVIVASLIVTVISAFVLYSSNYDTRQFELKVQAQERAIEKARGDIAVLKAERAHLARPERIEPFARAAGLGPATEKQLATSPQNVIDRVVAAQSALSQKKGN